MAAHTKTNRIGIILPTSSNNSAQTLIDHAMQYAADHNCELLIGLSQHDLSKEISYLKFFSETTDGIIIISVAEDFLEISPYIPDAFPMVFLYRKLQGCPLTTILENNFSAIQQVLVSQMNEGHSKIGCLLGKSDFVVSTEAEAAYRATFGIAPDDDMSDTIIHLVHATVDSVGASIEKLKQHGCTSIFAGTQHLTTLALNYLLLHNPNGKSGIELSGIADPLYDNALSQSIDSVQQPTFELAELALQQIFCLMETPDRCQDFVLKSRVSMKSLSRFYSVTTNVS